VRTGIIKLSGEMSCLEADFFQPGSDQLDVVRISGVGCVAAQV